MNKTSRAIFYCLLNIMVSIPLQAQDPQISQPFAVGSTISPAFTGMNFQDNVQLLYRNQFPSMAGNYTFGLLSVNMILPEKQSGFGLTASYDEQFRNLKTTSLSLRYAYHLIVSKKSLLSMGIEGGWQHRALDFGTYVFPDNVSGSLVSSSFDPTINSLANSRNFFDLNAGVLYYSKRSWIGISTHHINKPNQSVGLGAIDYLQRKYALQIGSNFDVFTTSSPIEITPVIYLKNQGKLVQIDLGTYVHVKQFELGLWYRGVPFVSSAGGNEAVVGLIGYTKDAMSIGFSHDILLSGISGFASGANEITFNYFFNSEKEGTLQKFLRKRGRLPCPRF